MMDLTIAVCTRNRAELLRNALESIRGARIPDGLEWEVLVVDNDSTDDTGRCVARMRAWLPVRLVRERQVGVSHARNRALAESRGRYVLFTDDDVIVEDDWVMRFWDAVERHPHAAAIGGRIDPMFGSVPDAEVLAAFPMAASGFCGLSHDVAEGPLEAPLPLFTANLGLRRDALGGLRFDPALGPSPQGRLVGEDAALLDALRARGDVVIWCPQMRVRHFVEPSRLTLQYLVQHHVGYSEAMVLLRGMPDDAAWLPARCAVNWLLYALLRVAGQRRRSLTRLRAFCHWLGTIRGKRRLDTPLRDTVIGPFDRPSHLTRLKGRISLDACP